MNPIAMELNDVLQKANPYVYNMLSEVGKNLFYPKGILTQSAEAKDKAHKFNATIGMATEDGSAMYLPSVMTYVNGLTPDQVLTYAPSYGILPLRQAWREELYVKNPALKGREISLPVVTNAITHGLAVVSEMWVDPGNVILLPDKMWGNYNLVFGVRRGARIVQYNTFRPGGTLDLEAFEACVREQAAQNDKIVVILNFPNNPTGYSPTETEAEAIAAILGDTAAKGTNVVAVLDDAYFGLFYEPDTFTQSIFVKLMGRDPRLLCIKLDGATKENFVWGLRVGFITYGAVYEGDARIFYEALEKKSAGDVRGSISNASHLGQQMVLNSMRAAAYREEKQQKFEVMQARAREVKRVLTDPRYADAWEPYPFNSGYFMCLKLKKVAAEPLRLHLLDKYGVGLISLGSTDLRVAFSCVEKKDIKELFDLIYQGAQDLA